jgi:hypothetical protein
MRPAPSMATTPVSRGNPKSVFQNQIRLTQPFLDVALAPGQTGKAVMHIQGKLVFRTAVVRSDIVVQSRRAGLHRFERIEDRRQRFVIDVDCGNCLFGGFDRLRRDGCHAVADEAHDVPAEDGHVADLFADIESASVITGDERLDAGHFARFRDIDLPYARMGIRAAKDFPPERFSLVNVGGVEGATADFVCAFRSRHWHADELEIKFASDHGISVIAR